jgi:iron(III) transport system permease protein
MIEAARVLEASRARIWLRVVLPLMAPGLAAAAAAVFALTAGELGATLIVTPPGRATLTLRIYNFLHYGASDMVGGLCLVMTGLVMGAGVLGVLVVAAWSRAGVHGAERTA